MLSAKRTFIFRGAAVERPTNWTSLAQIDDAFWTKAGTTVTADAAVAPDFTTTADKLCEDNTNAIHRILNTAVITCVIGKTYGFHIYAKAAERSEITLQPTGAAPGTGGSPNFDITNATMLLIGTNIQSSIERVGNDGWCHLGIKWVAPSTGAAGVRVYLSKAASGIGAYQGITGEGAFLIHPHIRGF
jgi:hypothetical protein